MYPPHHRDILGTLKSFSHTLGALASPFSQNCWGHLSLSLLPQGTVSLPTPSSAPPWFPFSDMLNQVPIWQVAWGAILFLACLFMLRSILCGFQSSVLRENLTFCMWNKSQTQTAEAAAYHFPVLWDQSSYLWNKAVQVAPSMGSLICLAPIGCVCSQICKCQLY